MILAVLPTGYRNFWYPGKNTICEVTGQLRGTRLMESTSLTSLVMVASSAGEGMSNTF
ncbi:hypothetical protein Kisp02_61040 [Kineosporia sp. NBRC 101731]|nr:hypothetical protein Kisp02_61040 [Kineosporia sp. NBRC 101731]